MSTPSQIELAPPRARTGFRAWPLWATAAGVLATAGTVAFDVRPAAELEAWLDGGTHTVVPADVLTIDHVASRLGWTVGLLSIACLLVFSALWRRHVERRFGASTGARVVSSGIIATSGAAMLGYGWKGALANYLGPEAGMYDEQGLFVYYMLTDFGAFLPWFGVTVAALAIAWMAFVERIASRALGAVSALMGLGIVAFTFVTGVPGLPGVYGPLWLAIAGLWLAVGRSAITRTEVA